MVLLKASHLRRGWPRGQTCSVHLLRRAPPDKPEVFDDKNIFSCFINLKQNPPILFCTLTDKAQKAQSGMKDILCRSAVYKNE